MSEKISFTATGRVWLRLPSNRSYKPNRQIGKCNYAKRCFLTRRTERQVMRINNSIGISVSALKQMRESGLIDYIIIELQEGSKIRKLKTTPEFFLAHGEYLYFKENELELQIFLKINLFGMLQAMKWKKAQDKLKEAEGENKN